MQLKIVTWLNEEVASDALSIHGYEHYEATDYALAAWYPQRRRPADEAEDAAASTSGRSTDFTKWWADGDEPLYYIVSSKVSHIILLLNTPAAIPACLLLPDVIFLSLRGHK